MTLKGHRHFLSKASLRGGRGLKEMYRIRHPETQPLLYIGGLVLRLSPNHLNTDDLQYHAPQVDESGAVSKKKSSHFVIPDDPCCNNKAERKHGYSCKIVSKLQRQS